MKIGEEVCIINSLLHAATVTGYVLTGADQPRTGRDRTHYSSLLGQMLTFLIRTR